MKRFFLGLAYTLLLAPAAFAQGTSNLKACLMTARQANTPSWRDQAAIDCVQRNKKIMTASRCVNIANRLEYSLSAENLKMFCLDGLAKATSLSDCFGVANSFEYADNGDVARWSCLKKFNRKMSVQYCAKMADKMSYPSNQDRARTYCLDELVKNPTMKECIDISHKTNPSFMLTEIKSDCRRKILSEQ